MQRRIFHNLTHFWKYFKKTQCGSSGESLEWAEVAARRGWQSVCQACCTVYESPEAKGMKAGCSYQLDGEEAVAEKQGRRNCDPVDAWMMCCTRGRKWSATSLKVHASTFTHSCSYRSWGLAHEHVPTRPPVHSVSKNYPIILYWIQGLMVM